jgi:hypothetical protein
MSHHNFSNVIDNFSEKKGLSPTDLDIMKNGFELLCFYANKKEKKIIESIQISLTKQKLSSTDRLLISNNKNLIMEIIKRYTKEVGISSDEAASASSSGESDDNYSDMDNFDDVNNFNDVSDEKENNKITLNQKVIEKECKLSDILDSISCPNKYVMCRATFGEECEMDDIKILFVDDPMDYYNFYREDYETLKDSMEDTFEIKGKGFGYDISYQGKRIMECTSYRIYGLDDKQKNRLRKLIDQLIK